jgi:hypothetical protein
MRIEFTKEEIEHIILAHANALVQTGDKPFNKVETSYPHIPSTAAVEHVPAKEDDQ